MPRDPASDQLNEWKKKNGVPGRAVNVHGCPVASLTASLTVGRRGPILLQDTNLIDQLANWTRERIPERVVHSKGSGAKGYFEVTNDITKYCKARIFEKVGKITKCAARFSTVAGERGSPDTVRDPRGFACKFYTDDGIWDHVGNNTPIFFIRDPLYFPSNIRILKRNPTTNLRDNDMFWDYMTLLPESTHQLLLFFSDRGTPDGYRFMHGYSSHTYAMVNSKGERFYVKFHWRSDQGIKNLTEAESKRIASDDPDYATRDLFNAIAKGNYPSWTLNIQVMTLEESRKYKWNPFDLTKVWLHSDYPLIPVGRMVLNENPSNYFADVEQAAYDPANMVPGIEPSPDRMLQGRLFAYADTHRHRLGANYIQLPINRPQNGEPSTYTRDGPMNVHSNTGGAPNYFPNTFNGPVAEPRAEQPPIETSGEPIDRYDITGDDQDNFSQADLFWKKVLKQDDRRKLCQNMAEHLSLASDYLQDRALKMFANVNYELTDMLAEELKKANSINESKL